MPLTALSADEFKRLMMSVGTHRAERFLSPIEVSQLLSKAVDGGASLAECGEVLHLDGTSQVSRFIALSRLPPEVQHLVDWGRSEETVAFTAAFEISRLARQEDQRTAIEAVLENGLSSSETRQLVQTSKRSGKAMEECVAGVLKMRPQVEIRHVLVGLIQAPELRSRLKALTQQERDALLKRALQEVANGFAASGRLGVDRFTLIGGADLGRAIKEDKQEIEKQVNAALASDSEQ